MNKAGLELRLGTDKFASCHGQIHMNMNLQTFSDFRFMIDVVKEIL